MEDDEKKGKNAVAILGERIGKRRMYKPWCQFDSVIIPPASRRQVTVGSGVPVAAHRIVTLLPSLTTISVLVG